MFKKICILLISYIIFIGAFASYYLASYNYGKGLINNDLIEDIVSDKESSEGSIITNKQIGVVSEDIIQKDNMDNLKFFGVWSLDRIVLESKNYYGKNYGGYRFHEHDYLGYEVEYSSQFFRLGDEKFFGPEYKLYDFKLYDYNNNGNFELPDLYDLIRNEKIEIDKMDQFVSIDDINLAYFVVDFKENHFIPIGTQCILLNEDTMLVGVWGNIILAHRVKK